MCLNRALTRASRAERAGAGAAKLREARVEAANKATAAGGGGGKGDDYDDDDDDIDQYTYMRVGTRIKSNYKGGSVFYSGFVCSVQSVGGDDGAGNQCAPTCSLAMYVLPCVRTCSNWLLRCRKHVSFVFCACLLACLLA